VVMSADWSEYWLVVMSGDWSGSGRRPVRGPAGGLVGDRARTDRRTDREDRVGGPAGFRRVTGRFNGGRWRWRNGHDVGQLVGGLSANVGPLVVEYWSEYWLAVMSADWSEYWSVVMSETGQWSVGRLVGDQPRTGREDLPETWRTGGVWSEDWSVQRWALAFGMAVGGDVGQLVGRTVTSGTAGRSTGRSTGPVMSADWSEYWLVVISGDGQWSGRRTG
jgi:hypothetical protein